MTKKSIAYSINISDIQQVAEEDIDRRLSKKEVQLVAAKLGDYLDWYQAISFAIQDMETKKLGEASTTEATMADRARGTAKPAKVGAGDTAKKTVVKKAAAKKPVAKKATAKPAAKKAAAKKAG